MINIFKMNEWPIKKFSIIILPILLAYLGSLCINVLSIYLLGFKITILQNFLGFFILTFIPGILIIRMMKLRNLNSVESLLYSVGLSLSFLMGIGFIINNSYNYFGISEPLSSSNIIIALYVSILFLYFICYFTDDGYSKIETFELEKIMSPIILFLLMIPFLAIFGTYLLNTISNNSILLLTITLMSFIPVLVSAKYISKQFYPLVLFIITISLLFHQSLVSAYITGWDIQSEYYFSNLSVNNSIWNSNIPNNLASMLSICVLPVIYKKVLDIELVSVFKVIYPLLFSIVPLGLYQVYSKQINKETSFLSVILFVSFFGFYADMTSLARQEIAEIFFTLIILLMVTKDINKVKKAILSIVFLFSLAVSHYALSYIYMFSLIFVWVILIILEREKTRKVSLQIEYQTVKFKNCQINTKNKTLNSPENLNTNNSVIRSSFVLVFVVFALFWYMTFSNSSSLGTIYKVFHHIITNISSDFMNPELSQTLNIVLSKQYSLLHSMNKYFQLAVQFFIFVGFMHVALKRYKSKFTTEYFLFACFNILIWTLAVIVPYFAKELNASRLYHITLIFLAPFCPIGGQIFIISLSKIKFEFWKNKSFIDPLIIMSIFLSIYLLFNTGFIYEVTNDNPSSFALNSSVDSAKFTINEVFASEWLINVKTDGGIYADGYRGLIFNGISNLKSKNIPENDSEIPIKSYIYFGKYNIEQGKYFIHMTKKASTIDTYQSCVNIMQNNSKIYDNSKASVYYKEIMKKQFIFT